MSNSIADLDLGLPPSVHAQLAAEVPSVAHYITRTAPVQAGGHEEWEEAIQNLDTYILHNIVPQVRSGVDLYNDAGILRSTGSPRLDALLGSGYRQGQLIELVGESGSGKTQVCLLAAAANAAAGVQVSYIDTGNGFSSHRIAQVFQALPPSQRGAAQLPDVLACIEVQKAFDAQALLNAVNSLAGGFAATGAGANSHMPQLVLVDSFSGVFSPVLSRQHMQGNALMIGAARLLKCLAVQHGMVVIVVNHIVGSAQDRKPALGEHWLPQPHTRVHLQRQQGPLRMAVLKASTVLPPGGSTVLDMDDLTGTRAAAATAAAAV